ncbi:cytosolic Cu/Zn superoxide dismutase [Aspergillus heteromorphus CBS 117.55]|uniref:superoxide dismutase n=1 Tax=Aspergillus heteromorphus CBS 117.55 TaxID=1448321 RepID=A0A317WTS5_9EURO|nr:cytosolic Cu/Zn superoxide dismutase [Aspergillus heteromorphus CBS 117.55]PWY89729.1 cytosolic Cu/Zn superoxide dismutase [Aspergillus heteromorphus CBS 117.55]
MFSKTLLVSLGLAAAATATATATATNAPVTTDNTGLQYRAVLQPKDNTTVTGHITTYPGPSQVGLNFFVELWGIPDGEALSYHIHNLPVPEDGNCYSTGSHLDPYARGDATPCDIHAPQTCQVGDLSGKHGPAFAPDDEAFSTVYTDWFVSSLADDPAFLGNRSFVVHAPDNTRLACGNFAVWEGH